jgi:outer membrane protein TolC
MQQLADDYAATRKELANVKEELAKERATNLVLVGLSPSSPWSWSKPRKNLSKVVESPDFPHDRHREFQAALGSLAGLG